MCGERALRHLALIWGSNRFRQRQHLRTGFITPQMPCQDLCLALKAPGIERLGSLACFKIDADREDGCHKREHSALHNYMIGGGLLLLPALLGERRSKGLVRRLNRAGLTEVIRPERGNNGQTQRKTIISYKKLAL